MAECPSDDELSQFLNESLPMERTGGVSVHVDGCTACQGRLDKLTHDTDGAVARFKDRSLMRTLDGRGLSGAGTLIIGINTLPSTRLIGLPTVPGFDVIEEIGRGGMGVVYKARHQRLNRLVALKMVLAGAAADARMVQRFLFEAEILARVQHPQVVQVYEVDTFVGPTGVPIPYLAMELLEGGSLSKRLRGKGLIETERKTDGEKKQIQLDQRTVAELIEGIARAVHSAHLQGVIHRDLKPGNILFASEEFGPAKEIVKSPGSGALNSAGSGISDRLSAVLPKVTDFGLAKFKDAGADLTGSGQVVGTPYYMSPEQAAGSKQIGPPADVYALGAILFECLAGRPPFEGSEPMSVLFKVVSEAPPDVRSLCLGLHRDLAAVVMRCLAKDPRRRYASAADLADDLRRFLEMRPTVARPVSVRERVWLGAKRNPAVAGLITALVIVLLAAFTGVTVFWLKAEQTALDERHARKAANLAEARAIESQNDAALSLKEANRQKTIADFNQAHLEFARAVNWCQEGRVKDGLNSFIRAVELAEATGDMDLARVARANLAAWPRVLPSDRTVFVHPYQPRDIAFFPDTRRAVVASRGANLFLWDTKTDQKVLTYRPTYKLARFSPTSLGLSFTLWSAAVSPDGKTVVAGGTDGQVWVWDVDKPEAQSAFVVAEPGVDIWATVFAHDGTLWVTDGRGGIQRLDLAEKKVIARAKSPEDRDVIIQSLVLSADGKRLFTGNRSGRIQEWDAASLKPLRSWKAEGWVSHLALSPNGAHLAATGTEGLVRVMDLTTGEVIHKISLAGAYGKGVAFSPKRSLLVVSDADGNVRGWDWKTGVPVGVPLQLTGEVLCPRFFPGQDEFAIAVGNSIHRCRLADMPGQLLTGNEEVRIHGIDYSPDGNRLAIARNLQLIEVDLASGKQSHSKLKPKFGLTIHYDPDRDRNRLVRGYADGFDIINLPGFVQGEERETNRAMGIRFSPGGLRMYQLDKDDISVWDPMALSMRLARFRDPDMPTGVELTAMDVRPDGREVMINYANKAVFLDPQSLEKSRPGWNVADDILDAKYLPGGSKVLVGRRDSVAQIVDAATGKPISRPMTHTRAVLAMAASPDGNVLLTGSRDGMAQFWDTATGLPLGPPLRHAGSVTHVVYNPNGTQAATGSGSGEVLIWSPPPPPISGTLDELRATREKHGE
jgi:serine/threonine protein kinase/WD40 repeat protein